MSYHDLDDHPFSPASVARESGESQSERAWLRWIARAEALCGHSLDGSESGNGYSYDSAFDAFCAEWSPRGYVESIYNRPR